MNQHPPLSQEEKNRIYRGKLAGKTLVQLATELGCSLGCVRKWWRVGRKEGETGLQRARVARGPLGTLSQFSVVLAEAAIQLKQLHPGWGADRVKVALAQDTRFRDMVLPSRSRLAALFKEHCPESLAARHARPPKPLAPSRACAVHEVWQLDSQEGIRLRDATIATVCSIRDPFSAAMIASQAFVVQTPRHWRKLTWIEIRQVLRQGFSEWSSLPEVVLTDNELVQAGNPENKFPARLTLWLAGMSIQHQFIRPGRPTDQPQVERNHRTLAGWTQDATGLGCLADLQAALDRERTQYNAYFPARAGSCAAQPPLQAHPELLHPRRPYLPELESHLFDLQQVFDFLARLRFRRKVQQKTAFFSLGDQLYGLGRVLLRRHQLKTVQVQMDADTHQWVIFTDSPEPQEVHRMPPKGLDFLTLTGLEPPLLTFQEPVQLLLPFWLPELGVRLL